MSPADPDPRPPISRTENGVDPPAPDESTTAARLAAILGDRTDAAGNVRLPWLLRGSSRSEPTRPRDRELDRMAALAARRTSLMVLPIVAIGWLAVALLAPGVLRVATVVALVLSVFVGVRAAVTTQQFRRRWMDKADVLAPPMWITLGTVACALATIVGIANVVADLRADRSAVLAMIISMVALGLLGLGIFAHLAGGRSVAAALRK